MALANVWHLRRVANTSSKACDICYKPTTSVLVTPDNRVRPSPGASGKATHIQQDFFFVCAGHLKDRGFATPNIDEAEAAAKKKKAALDEEVSRIKQEYDEKLKRRKDKKAKDGKEIDETKGKAKETEKDTAQDAQAKIEKEEKVGGDGCAHHSTTATNKDALDQSDN